MTESRAKAIKLYWNIAKERCPFHEEEMVNSFLEGFIDCAEFLLPLIEKMKCCGNCGVERCTSKYRGNAAYHRQTDGFACADNEEWKIKENHTCNNCKHYSSQYELCCYSMGDSDYDCRGRKWEIKEK